MSALSLLLCQIPIEWEQPETNCSYLDRLLKKHYARTGCRDRCSLLALPEFFSCGFSLNRNCAEPPDGPSLRWMKHCAAAYGTAVVGTVPVAEEDRLYNRNYFVTPDGREYHYDKKHLFTPGKEAEVFSPGREKLIVSYEGWNIALNTCYDLRFPLWEKNTGLSYDLMLIPASWPANRIAVTEALLKSRAIENLAYYAFVNRVGQDPDNCYDGRSRIVDYLGNDVEGDTYSADGATLMQVILDKLKLEKFREKFPVWKDWDICEIKNSFISLS